MHGKTHNFSALLKIAETILQTAPPILFGILSGCAHCVDHAVHYVRIIKAPAAHRRIQRLRTPFTWIYHLIHLPHFSLTLGRTSSPVASLVILNIKGLRPTPRGPRKRGISLPPSQPGRKVHTTQKPIPSIHCEPRKKGSASLPPGSGGKEIPCSLRRVSMPQ